MGDIDSVTGVNLVQLEKRPLKIEKLKKLKIGSFFICFYCWVIWQYIYFFFSEYLTNSRFCKIFISQLENVTTT